METRHFAERVLFSTTLEDKLLGAGDLSDETPGGAILTPGAPGRPANLGMQRGGRAPFPAAHQLIDEEQRGILLHFSCSEGGLRSSRTSSRLARKAGKISKSRASAAASRRG